MYFLRIAYKVLGHAVNAGIVLDSVPKLKTF